MNDSPKKKTVLSVDDCPLTQKIIEKVLRQHYRVIAASDGETALHAIYQEPIDLILLDVNMPGIDGLEICRTVRNLSQFYALPIIMITSRDGAFDKVQGKMAGATEYLTKPFDASQLLGLLAQYI